MFIVATGPTELHAHIDLDNRLAALGRGGDAPAATVLDTAEHDGHWSVVATVDPHHLGDHQ